MRNLPRKANDNPLSWRRVSHSGWRAALNLHQHTFKEKDQAMEHQLPPIANEGQQPLEKSQNVTDKAARYVFFWRTSGLTANAKTLDEMIVSLESSADALRLLKEAGV